MVNDAARDGSADILERFAATRPWILNLTLSRNFGQHAATIAGILHSSGDWVVTLDEDLQHPPNQIENMLRHATTKQADVVYARPASAEVHGKAWRDGSSRSFKRLMEWLTGNPTLRLVNSFRLMRGDIARATASVCSHNTYFDIALFWFTQRIRAITMDLRDERFAATGTSSYNFKTLVNHAQKMLFSSQLRFLTFGLWIGVGLFAFSILSGLYFTLVRLIAPEAIEVEGWTSLFVVLTMSAGLLAAMLGLCLQYLATLVLKAHGRPTFFTIDRSSDQNLQDWYAQQDEVA
ncbi:Glycosyltransferase involved in cell wall bisynthesis [Primorskyibacter flagellatus]|uniref:Glycosyltransferase involved in cell wall bisynthesis n=2 Tax=Primorskyibacter flagellatus TaxID=1387277 RepID=A0A1W2E1M8_9RHOB|nr:Glycosyltransferase involved in cell wall bisynthesis [Primorskyibacter flagellatus]